MSTAKSMGSWRSKSRQVLFRSFPSWQNHPTSLYMKVMPCTTHFLEKGWMFLFFGWNVGRVKQEPMQLNMHPELRLFEGITFSNLFQNMLILGKTMYFSFPILFWPPKNTKLKSFDQKLIWYQSEIRHPCVIIILVVNNVLLQKIMLFHQTKSKPEKLQKKSVRCSPTGSHQQESREKSRLFLLKYLVLPLSPDVSILLLYWISVRIILPSHPILPKKHTKRKYILVPTKKNTHPKNLGVFRFAKAAKCCSLSLKVADQSPPSSGLKAARDGFLLDPLTQLLQIRLQLQRNS